MNKMQQQQQPMSSSAPSTPLNLVSTEQIQKYLDENKNLIMAILENQNLGKMAECAQYQAVLQKNLMYLAAIADAQPPGSGSPSQPSAGPATPQGNAQMLQQTQASMMQQQQQAGAPMPKLPFQLNALRPQDPKSQILQFQQQQQQSQAHFSGGGPPNSGLHQLMQQGHGSNMVGGNPAGTLDGHPSHRQGNSGSGPGEGRD